MVWQDHTSRFLQSSAPTNCKHGCPRVVEHTIWQIRVSVGGFGPVFLWGEGRRGGERSGVCMRGNVCMFFSNRMISGCGFTFRRLKVRRSCLDAAGSPLQLVCPAVSSLLPLLQVFPLGCEALRMHVAVSVRHSLLLLLLLLLLRVPVFSVITPGISWANIWPWCAGLHQQLCCKSFIFSFKLCFIYAVSSCKFFCLDFKTKFLNNKTLLLKGERHECDRDVKWSEKSPTEEARGCFTVQENLVQLRQLFGIFSLTPLYCIYWLPVCENHLDLMELCNIADILERLELLETTWFE